MANPLAKPDEYIAGEATRDLAGKASGRGQWRDYDERFVLQRVLHAIREAKGD